MQQILASLAEDQHAALMRDADLDVTVQLSTGVFVTGIIESTSEGVLTMRRLVHADSYADIPRHYRIDAVVSAYFTEGS